MGREKEIIDCLQAIPWFQSIAEKHLLMIASISSIVTIDRGEFLFKQGDKQGDMFILVNGKVSVELNSPERGYLRIYTAEPMDVVGFSSVTPVIRQRTASARAVLDSCLVALDSASLYRLCEQDHELGYLVLRRLANVAASRVMISRQQLVDQFSHHVGEVENA
jgi:CRP-like cAMP-binding protein